MITSINQYIPRLSRITITPTDLARSERTKNRKSRKARKWERKKNSLRPARRKFVEVQPGERSRRALVQTLMTTNNFFPRSIFGAARTSHKTLQLSPSLCGWISVSSRVAHLSLGNAETYPDYSIFPESWTPSRLSVIRGFPERPTNWRATEISWETRDELSNSPTRCVTHRLTSSEIDGDSRLGNTCSNLLKIMYRKYL